MAAETMVVSSIFILLCALLAAPSVQSTSPPVAAAQQAQSSQMKTGQVETGARASEHPAVPLHQLLTDHSWLALEEALEKTTDPDANFYRGVLENRLGHYSRSVELLEPLLPAIASSADRAKEKQARMALADDYFRTFGYRKAAEEYEALNKCCASLLTADERADIEIPTKLLPMLEAAKPQTLEVESSFTVPVEENALGLHDVSVWVDGYAARWLFDPAESFTMLSRSQAKLAGLKLSEDLVTIYSVTGEPIAVHATVVPQLKFSGAVFHNVPAMVYDDADLYDKAHRYQIEGVLAQPLLAALGQITMSDDEHLTVSREARLKEGAPFFSDGRHLIVAAGAKGSEELYAVDPGSTESLLTSRYYDAHMADFAHAQMELVKPSGAGESAPLPAYRAENVTLSFGGVPVTFHELEVLAQPAGEERDRFWGTLREGALEQLESYTFDFRTMRFVARGHP
jgi:hypothetical protein